MYIKLCAVALLFTIGFNTVVLAEENWQYSAENYNQNYSAATNSYSNSTNENNYNNTYNINAVSDEYSYSGHVYTNTNILNNTTSTKTTEKNNSSFSDNHPVITGVGIGILAIGLIAVGALISDNDNDHRKSMHKDRHNRDYQAHHDRPHDHHSPHSHHSNHHNNYSHR